MGLFRPCMFPQGRRDKLSERNVMMRQDNRQVVLAHEQGKEIKCVIWDLDNTVWRGILAEGDDVVLMPGIAETLEELDRRGILNSVASRNDHEDALSKLTQHGIRDYFLYPEIGWDTKSAAVGRIQENLNIGVDTFLFLDDQAFEREEVLSVHPEITCLDSSGYWEDFRQLLSLPRLNPRFVTEDSARRRLMYRQEMQRKKVEEVFEGPQESFLRDLNMTFVISYAGEGDLQRAEELTVRTNQLNATGRTYSYDELAGLIRSDRHKLMVCDLTDRFGSYGKIGLALVETSQQVWHIRLLLMSCRVMNRGVGTVFLSYIMNEAKAAGARLLADFVPTKRNRQMYLTYKFANFRELEAEEENVVLLENDLSYIQPFPNYINVMVPD